MTFGPADPRGAVVWRVTSVSPVPVTDPGLKLQEARLPAGAIVQEAGEKLTVAPNPFSAVSDNVTGSDCSPGAAMFSGDRFDGTVVKMKSGGGGGPGFVIVSVVEPAEGT